MAHKEETYEQFLETLSSQLGRMKRLDATLGQTPQSVYHGDDHPDQDEEDDLIRPNNQAHLVRSFSNRRAKWDETPEEEKQQQYPVDMSMARNPERNAADVSTKNMRFKGGYSTDMGRYPQNRKEEPTSSVGLEPRVEMNRVKKMIKEKETELHELQQKKVQLMRKITGRLESNNNKFEDNVAFFQEWNNWSEYKEERDPNEPGTPEWNALKAKKHANETKRRTLFMPSSKKQPTWDATKSDNRYHGHGE